LLGPCNRVNVFRQAKRRRLTIDSLSNQPEIDQAIKNFKKEPEVHEEKAEVTGNDLTPVTPLSPMTPTDKDHVTETDNHVTNELEKNQFDKENAHRLRYDVITYYSSKNDVIICSVQYQLLTQ